MVKRFPRTPGRDWSALTPAYRARLERSGISRRDYESGASVQAARGHATTPEHAGGELSYNQLATKIANWKQQEYGNGNSFNERRSREAASRSPKTGKKHDIAIMFAISRAIDDGISPFDILDEQGIDIDDSPLPYH